MKYERNQVRTTDNKNLFEEPVRYLDLYNFGMILLLCLYFLSAGIIGMHHHAQLQLQFQLQSEQHRT
jgi:hypothetical protein